MNLALLRSRVWAFGPDSLASRLELKKFFSQRDDFTETVDKIITDFKATELTPYALLTLFHINKHTIYNNCKRMGLES